MILDTLNNLEKYQGINKYIKPVITFCQNNDLLSLDEGRFKIDGDNVFGIAMTCDLRLESGALLESHKKYIDIQLLLDGQESIGFAPTSSLCKGSGFNAQDDIEFWQDKCQFMSNLQEGQFALFLPSDAHLPLIGNGKVKKIVFKLAVD